MADLTSYVNQSKIRTNIYWFSINPRNHILKLKYSQNTWRLINFLSHCYHFTWWYNRPSDIYYSTRLWAQQMPNSTLPRNLSRFWSLIILLPFASIVATNRWLNLHPLPPPCNPCSSHLQHEHTYRFFLHNINRLYTLDQYLRSSHAILTIFLIQSDCLRRRLHTPIWTMGRPSQNLPFLHC